MRLKREIISRQNLLFLPCFGESPEKIWEEKKIKKTTKLLSTMLALAMVFSLFVVMSQKAKAAPAVIDISTTDGGATIGGSARLTSNPAGQDTWHYNAAGRQLVLTGASGNYTLTGTNSNLFISINPSAANASVTLNGVNCTSQSNYSFSVSSNCTVTLTGVNTLHSDISAGFIMQLDVNNCTINGSGSLTVTKSLSSTSSYSTINLTNSSQKLQITGSANVRAAGLSPIANYSSNLFLGDNASLTLTNNSGSEKKCTVGRADSGGNSQWRLSDSATTTGSLSAESIDVKIAAGGTGTVRRAKPTIIDISTTDGGATIGGTAKQTSNAPGAEAWTYNASSRTLLLGAASGIYTLTGMNPNLKISVSGSAANATVTLNSVNFSTQSNASAFDVQSNCTVTLTGSNSLRSERADSSATNSGMTIGNSVTCTINGNGKLAVMSLFGMQNRGITVPNGSFLRIAGSTSVTVTGTGPNNIIYTSGSVLLGDNASLTMANSGATAYTRTIDRADTGEDSRWKLSGSATTTDSLISSTINVTIPANTIGTISREWRAPATIDIFTLDSSNRNSTSGVDKWSYNANSRTLTLSQVDGDYTLTGTNNNLYIVVANTAANAKVTLDGIDCTGREDDATFSVQNNCEITLSGSNTIKNSQSNPAISVFNSICTMRGSGSLTATINLGDDAIRINSGSTLRIIDNANVSMAGVEDAGAISTSGKVQLGNNASLTMTNNFGSAVTRVIERYDTNSGVRWDLTGNITTTDPLTEPTVNVTTPPGGTGTVRRVVMTIIDISMFGASNINSPAGHDAWNYNAATRKLSLTKPSGEYTLTKANSNLSIEVASTATNAKVTLFNVNCNSDLVSPAFSAGYGCTVTLEGVNILTSGNITAVHVAYNSACTINGSGSLTATSSTNTVGIYLGINAVLRITDTAAVTAVGGAGAIDNYGNVLIGDEASLKMTNNSGSAKSYTVGRADSGGSSHWNLTGSVTTSDSLYNDTINVTVPAGGTGTITRILEMPAIIDISLLGPGNSSNPAGQYAWSYTDYSASEGFLNLSEPGGFYILTGTNTNRDIWIISAEGANITFDEMNCPPTRSLQFFPGNNTTVTLIGSNTLRSSYDTALNVFEFYSCTINGSGSLTAVSIISAAIIVDYNSSLSILDSASVMAVGVEGGITAGNAGRVLLGDNASLTLTNNGSSDKTRTISRADSGGISQWWLAGSAMTADALTASTINVTIPAESSGVILRDIPTIVTWESLTANGTSGAVSTTLLTFTFDNDPVTLTAGDITVPGARKVELTGTGNTRILEISDIAVPNGTSLTVSITNPSLYAITPSSKAVTVCVKPVSQIGSTVYGRFIDAWLAHTNSQTIRLLDDITFTDEELSIQNKTLTLDLNGKVLNISPWNTALSVINGQLNLTGSGQLNLSSMEGALVVVNGKATITNATDLWTYGGGGALYADNAEITVLGNVTASDPEAFAAQAINGSKITIEGRINTPAGGNYILVGTTAKSPSQGTTSPTKPGYLTYTDGTNTVWVKIASVKQGDINRDGDVNVLDLSILLANFGKSGGAILDQRADINNDGDINVLDLSILLANFGK